MATLKGQSIAASYQDLVKRADTYSQTGTNIELMDDSGDVQATGLYLESGAVTDNVGIGTATPSTRLHVYDDSGSTAVCTINNQYGAGANNVLLVKGGANESSGKVFEVQDHGGQSDFVVTGTGNVGIGDTDPSEAKLSITGVLASDYGLKIDNDQNTTALYIDADGVTSNHTFFIDAPTTTSGRVVLVNDCDSLTTGSVALFTSNSSDVSVRKLVNIINDNTAAVGAIPLYIQQDSTGPAISATGGIVEQGGVLKENLLTNSGFDVWSNSTLVEATSGAAPVLDGANAALINNLLTNGGFDSATTEWAVNRGSLSSTAGGKTGNCLTITESGGGGGNPQAYQTVTTVVGKLYQFTAYVNDGTEATYRVYIGTGGAGTYNNYDSGDKNSSDDWTSSVESLLFEATGTSTTISIEQRAANASGTTLLVDSVTLYEVTPACVAANALAPDTMTKSSALNIWRQHNDGGTYTKDGSYYSLKATNTAATEYLYFKNVTLEEELQRFAGRNVAFGVWVKTDTASHARLRLYNGDANTYSTYHTGGNTWEWLEVTATIDASPDSVMFAVHLTTDTKTAYISQPMLVFGSSIGEGNYTRPQGEWVNLEERTLMFNDTESGDVAQTTLNLEAASDGKIPKGAKTVDMFVYARDSDSTTVGGCYYYLLGLSNPSWSHNGNLDGMPDDKFQYWQHTVPLDADGDLDYIFYASGSDTLQISFYANRVQLR